MNEPRYWLMAAALSVVFGSASPGVAGSGGENLSISTDRPGAADGTTNVAMGHFQVETGVNSTFGPDGLRVNFADTLFRYGLTQRFELRLFTSPFGVSSRSAAGSRVHPLGTLTLGGKFSYDFGENARVAAIPYVSLNRALASGRSLSGGMRLAADIGLQQTVGLTFNLGLSAVGQSDDTVGREVFASVVANVSLSESIGTFYEVYTVAPPEAPIGVYADAGVTWALTSRFQVDGWLGFEFATPTTTSTGVGVSYLF